MVVNHVCSVCKEWQCISVKNYSFIKGWGGVPTPSQFFAFLSIFRKLVSLTQEKYQLMDFTYFWIKINGSKWSPICKILSSGVRDQINIWASSSNSIRVQYCAYCTLLYLLNVSCSLETLDEALTSSKKPRAFEDTKSTNDGFVFNKRYC